MNLDSRDVLRHLNQLGYKNITSTQLKDFMKDLKKLIDYEKKLPQCGVKDKNRNILHECLRNLTGGDCKDVKRSTTTNYNNISNNKKNEVLEWKQANFKKSIEKVSSGKLKVIERDLNNKENDSRPNSRSSSEGKTYCVDERMSQKSDDHVKMWIRTTSFKPTIQRNDPVQLYHKYQKEWERNKQLIPGENDHSQLRWRIRSKLLSSS